MDESVIDQTAARLASALVRLYQLLTFWLPHRCRFAPTCSEYLRRALARWGFLNGMRFGVWRILKCHPWHVGGVDPVPERRGEPL